MDKEEKLTALNDAEGKILESEKMPRALCIVLTIVFIGILLSFSINFLVFSSACLRSSLSNLFSIRT